MTREEAKAYFEDCNDAIVTACKDQNIYDYEKQEIMGVHVRRAYEANTWAISALSENKGEWIRTKDQYGTYHFTCSKCGNDIATKSDAWDDNFCSECGADMRGE